MSEGEGHDAADEPVAMLRLFTEIGIIHQLASAAARETLTPLRLNPSEYALLNHFSNRGDGKTPSDLARIMQVAKPSMTAMLGKLSAKGFVVVSPDPDDARRQRVHGTDRGRAAHRAAAIELAAMVTASTAGLDRHALSTLVPTLAALRAHLDAQRD